MMSTLPVSRGQEEREGEGGEGGRVRRGKLGNEGEREGEEKLLGREGR